ncbi:hypothetical protein [Alicyclobacillus acidiphilus]|uniref:hypothetical protein n=1 Tax=Alicyclobacillus acidiphilus TaxID=182455 RepID=UPI0008299909|nr:hypothetical protein [Alicyclobacillus acidiphilus]
MEILSKDAWRRARRFIDEHAREIDLSLAAFYFDGGSIDSVRHALQAYQNEDGGFGRAIEPDFRLPASSAMATTVGLQYAVELGLTARDPIVQRAIQYLLDTFDEAAQRWHAVPDEVNEYPHAPWWTFDPTTGRCGVEGTWANPNAEIVGYLWRYSALVPEPFLQAITDKAMTELDALPAPIDMHDFLCYQRLAESLSQSHRSHILARLAPSVHRTVAIDPAEWEGYAAKPLNIAWSPRSPFTPPLREAIDANLDYEIQHLGEDGAWHPNWSWFGEYEEDWAKAQVEWAGHLTVKTLKALRDFDRVELD